MNCSSHVLQRHIKQKLKRKKTALASPNTATTVLLRSPCWTTVDYFSLRNPRTQSNYEFIYLFISWLYAVSIVETHARVHQTGRQHFMGDKYNLDRSDQCQGVYHTQVGRTCKRSEPSSYEQTTASQPPPQQPITLKNKYRVYEMLVQLCCELCFIDHALLFSFLNKNLIKMLLDFTRRFAPTCIFWFTRRCCLWQEKVTWS